MSGKNYLQENLLCTQWNMSIVYSMYQLAMTNFKCFSTER